jgi:hypothetical protein
MATTKNKTSTVASDNQIIAGITKDLKTVSSLVLAGTTYTPVTLIALIQSRINLINQVAASRAAWLDQVKQLEELDTQVHAVEMGLKQYVFNAFGKTSPQLADFGWTLKQRTPLTTEQKQQAVAKRDATRAARGTMSKKQKAAIHGVVPTTTAQPPATTTTPATQPAASTPTVNLVVTTQQAPAAAPAPAVVQAAPASTGGATTTTPKS